MWTGLSFTVIGLLISSARGQFPPIPGLEGLMVGNPVLDMMVMRQVFGGGSSSGGGGGGGGGGGSGSGGGGGGIDFSSLLLAQSMGAGGTGLQDILPALAMMEGSGNSGQGSGQANQGGQQNNQMMTQYAQSMANMLGNSGSGITPRQQANILQAMGPSKMQKIRDAMRKFADRTALETTGLGVVPDWLRLSPDVCPRPPNCRPTFFCEGRETLFTPESFYSCLGCEQCRMESSQRKMNTMRMAQAAVGGGPPSPLAAAAMAGQGTNAIDPMLFYAMQQPQQQQQQQQQQQMTGWQHRAAGSSVPRTVPSAPNFAGIRQTAMTVAGQPAALPPNQYPGRGPVPPAGTYVPPPAGGALQPPQAGKPQQYPQPPSPGQPQQTPPAGGQQQYPPPPQRGQPQYPPPPQGGQQQYLPPPPGAQQYQPPPPGGQQQYQPPPPGGQQQYQPPPPGGQQQYQAPPPGSQQQYQSPPPGGQQQYRPPPPGGQQQYQPPAEARQAMSGPPPLKPAPRQSGSFKPAGAPPAAGGPSQMPYLPQPPSGPPPKQFIEAMRKMGRQLEAARANNMRGPPNKRPPPPA